MCRCRSTTTRGRSTRRHLHECYPRPKSTLAIDIRLYEYTAHKFFLGSRTCLGADCKEGFLKQFEMTYCGGNSHSQRSPVYPPVQVQSPVLHDPCGPHSTPPQGLARSLATILNPGPNEYGPISSEGSAP